MIKEFILPISENRFFGSIKDVPVPCIFLYFIFIFLHLTGTGKRRILPVVL